jgi:hypothetical protein
MKRVSGGRLRRGFRAAGWTAFLTIFLMPAVLLGLATAARGDYPPSEGPEQVPVPPRVTPTAPLNPGLILPPSGREGLSSVGRPGGLARTGAELLPYVGIGLVLVVSGAVVLVATRRRDHLERSPQPAPGQSDI